MSTMSEDPKKKLYHPNEGVCIVTDESGKRYHLTAIGADISDHRVKLASEDGPARPGRHSLEFPDGTPFVANVSAGGDCDLITPGNIPLSFVFDYEGTPYLISRQLGNVALKYTKDYIWGVTRKEKSEEISVTGEVWTLMFAEDIMEPDKLIMTPANGEISVGNVRYEWEN